MTQIPAPQCVECKHFDGTRWNCVAFPGGIPSPIKLGEHDHTEPFPGDNGIRFEPIPDDANA